MPRNVTALHAETLSIEGGLFTAEWLAKVAAQQAPVQTDADYGVRAGFNVREEIGLAWRSAQSLWRQFDQSRQLAGHDTWGVTQRFASELLRQCFAFHLVQSATPILVADRQYPLPFTSVGGRVPVVISPHDEAKPLDTAHERLGDNAGERVRRRSAFGLLQESLNAMPAALWGLATNGVQLRIARDNASLTRPAWLEVDLERLFQEDRYADFSVLWLLLHASRFGGESTTAADCPLEQWRNACREHGTRARETLRVGVEQALLVLGQGFVGHPSNTALREALSSGKLTPQGYLRELLRLVYRNIFLLTVEEREVLHLEDADPAAIALYAEGYSLSRLRERAVRRSAHDRHGDLWQGLKQVWLGLADGQPRLALPALGGLFEATQCPTLDASKLENRHLLLAFFHLAWLREDVHAPLTRVNWRDMGPEELGSIYESLLELVPQLSHEYRQFSFQTGAATRGNARKTTGSYYTPDSLVQELLNSALEPIVASRLAAQPIGEEAVQALLSISVVDPACGSGHFLLAASRRIAGHLAQVRAQIRDSQFGNGGQATPDDYRHALRDVVTHCIYGVDMNPMALELARMALWLEAYTPDAPLGFIDHHFRLGNALLGMIDPKCLLDGVPDEAFKELTGDDKALCRDLRRKNKLERDGLLRMRAAASFSHTLEAMDLAATAAPLERLDALPDKTLEDITAKRLAWDSLRNNLEDDRQTLALNLYCSAFLLPKQGSISSTVVPTTQDVVSALLGQPMQREKQVAAMRLAESVPLLHWHLGFAQVFARGGFTVVLGNPPWDQSQVSDVEFFSSRAPNIAALVGDTRKKAIARLQIDEPLLWEEFQRKTRDVESQNCFYRSANRYPLTAVGKLNTYPLFAETALGILHSAGYAGLVLPSGIATDDSTKAFFQKIVDENRLASLVGFDNERRIFPAVHPDTPFCLLTLGKPVSGIRFAHYVLSVDDLEDSRRFFTLSPTDIKRLNPNTRTCPIFRSHADAEITKRIYERLPILWAEQGLDGNPWEIAFRQGLFNMASDSHLFRNGRRRHELSDPVPLYEAKLVHQFDPRWASYTLDGDSARELTDAEKNDAGLSVQPRYWVERSAVEDRLLEKGWTRQWLLGWRDITNATNERTVIASIIPRVGVGDTFLLLLANVAPSGSALLLADQCSLVHDYVARQKVGGTHLKYHVKRQLPNVPPSSYGSEVRNAIVSRTLELVYTCNDMQAFYNDVIAENDSWDSRTGADRGLPWPWNPERRALLRAEIDAIYAQLYGLTRDELCFVLDPIEAMGVNYPSETFRVLKEKEIQHHGEFRTRRLVLDAWDRMGF